MHSITIVFVVVFFLFSLLNIINLLLMNNIENRRQFGNLKALGFTNGYIFLQNILRILLLSCVAILLAQVLHGIISRPIFLISGGIDAMENPSEISGGEQQRVAIARALVGGAKLIFGDEPTGSLNSAMGNQVLDILTELNKKGQSIVMVTHDIKAAARATRLLYLADGRIAGDLNLGTYVPENTKEREESIFQFLKEHNW